jgi:hypothetical protein
MLANLITSQLGWKAAVVRDKETVTIEAALKKGLKRQPGNEAGSGF